MTFKAIISSSDSCTALGIAARRAVPVLALCRKLIAAGHDPVTRLEAYRGDMLCLTVRSIGEGAKLTVRLHRRGDRTVAASRSGDAG